MKRALSTIGVLALAGTLLWAAAAMGGAEERGAAEMILDGGSRGKVPFPHHGHQQALGMDKCQTCHELFPRQAGAIGKLVAEKTLNPKQVMNRQCVACHKERKKAGEKSGPVTCNQCHQR